MEICWRREHFRFRRVAGKSEFEMVSRKLFLDFCLIAVCLGSAIRGHAAEPTQQEGTPLVERLGAEAIQALHRAYDYEKTIPLEPRIVERIEKDGTIREKLVFRGVQGFLVPGYLEYPVNAQTALPCVLLLHGWSGSKEHWWRDGGYISGGDVRRSLLKSGFAIVALDAQCHGDRISQNDFAPVNHFADPALGTNPRKGYFTQQEIYIQTTRDYRRLIDYLETRPDLNSARIGMIGYSMGGAQTFLLTGVEKRIKASVAACTPADGSKFSSIAPQNFTTGLGDRPFLMIMGQTDEMCSPEKAREVYSMLETTKKDLIFLDAGHKLPPDYVPLAISWIEKHL